MYARRGRSSTRQPRRYSQFTVSARKHYGPLTGPRCSANFALVAAEHDGSLDVVRERGSRLIAEHGLEHGEDAIGRRRGGRAAGNLLQWTFYQWSTPSVKAWFSLDLELFVNIVVLVRAPS